jgi:hypothetical protein
MSLLLSLSPLLSMMSLINWGARHSAGPLLIALWSCLGFCDRWNSHERKLTLAVWLVLNTCGQGSMWCDHTVLGLSLLAQSSATECRCSRVCWVIFCFGGLGVSVLASGTQVCGFKPGRSRWIFQGEKLLRAPSFGREVKPWAPCRWFTACKRSLGVSWKSASRQN